MIEKKGKLQTEGEFVTVKVEFGIHVLKNKIEQRKS